MVAHAALVAEDARLHVVEIVLATLLKSGVVTLLLELLSLQIVTGVVLIADGEGYDIQVTQQIGR